MENPSAANPVDTLQQLNVMVMINDTFVFGARLHSVSAELAVMATPGTRLTHLHTLGFDFVWHVQNNRIR